MLDPSQTYISRAAAARYLAERFGATVPVARLARLAPWKLGPRPRRLEGRRVVYRVADLERWIGALRRELGLEEAGR